MSDVNSVSLSGPNKILKKKRKMKKIILRFFSRVVVKNNFKVLIFGL